MPQMLRVLPILAVLVAVCFLGNTRIVDVAAQPAGEQGEEALDEGSRAVFTMIHEEAERGEWAERSYSEIIEAVARALLEQPYVDGLLDVPERETLVADLTRFDCVLLVENVLAVAKGIALEDPSVEAYLRTLEDVRYRDGRRGGYCSRLHYFSEWIADNEARGRLENVTATLGGERFEKRFTFMGTHRASYPRLTDSDSLYACILDMEQRLNDLELFYIPQDRIAEAYPLMQSGDVIATATRIGGLDVSHSGFAIEVPGGGIGFLHASSSAGKVILTKDLQHYVQNIDYQVGIVVARPNAPRFNGE